MNIGKIDNSQSFQALNFDNLCSFDKNFIKNDLKKLQQLGEKYNIKLTSVYANTAKFGIIDVDVKPLNENLSFWERLFPPIGRDTFHTNENSIMGTVKNAIQDMASKISKQG